MAGEWQTTSLGDICTGIYDGPHATPPPSETGAVFLRIENITRSGRLDFSDIRRINDTDLSHWTRRVTPQPDDVVFSYEANLGLFARIPPGFHGCLGRRLALMRPNPSEVDAGYLLYACLAPGFQELLRQRTVLGSTVDRISLREFPSFEIPLPPLAEQKRIAHILGTLDDKIELNRRMNATLEGISRALFKSWFVDFDPVRQKAAGKQPVGMDAQTAALFPDSFEDSEIGEVPTGWGVGVVGDLYDVTMGQSPPGDTYNESGDGLPFFQGRADFCFRYPQRRVFCTAPTRFADPGDTLVSVRAPVGDLNMALERCAIGRGVAAVRHKTRALGFTYYGMHALSSSFEKFEGEGTVFGSMGKKEFHGIKAVAPTEDVIHAFEHVIAPPNKQIENHERQSSALATLRDTLLPKLLSGEIRVPEAEQAVEEAVG